MSTALSGDKSASYASNYVRSDGGELPVRWAAIEVLKEGKLSRASDVWSFGVLVYEVITRGKQPYPNMATLIEVSEFIKGGGTMSRPNECPESLFDNVMDPCWNPEPIRRPGFRTLHNQLLMLGAVRGEDPNRFVPSNSIKITLNGAGGSSTSDVGKRELQGPSIHHMEKVLLPKAKDAFPKGLEYEDTCGQTGPTIKDTVALVVKPAGATRTCPRDGRKGCAYVDTLKGPDHVGMSVALLSYTWSYKIESVVLALCRWAKSSNRNVKKSYIWICSLCLNQVRRIDCIELLRESSNSHVIV